MLLRQGFVFIVVAALSAGCTGGGLDALSFQSASLDDARFELVPESGGKDTVFKVDAAKFGEKFNVTWDWGDGSVSYGGQAEHKYGFTNGIMTVTMIATDDSGNQGIATRPLTLGTGINKAPTVTARAQKTWLQVGQVTNLTATGRDSDGDVLRYDWSWRAADGAAETLLPSKESRVPISFEAEGKYAVTVRARDLKGGDAVADLTIDVTKTVPSTRFEVTFNGTILAGSGGSGASEKLWVGEPVPDTNVDSTRHRYTLDYPATTLIFLTWNDTTAAQTQMTLQDLDLELRAADGTTVFKSEYHAQPSPASPTPATFPFEYNITQQQPGDYDVIVKGYAAANLNYTVLVQSTLQITPDLVRAAGG